MSAPALAASPAATARGPRIASIDVIRGLVMVVMAIDHVRVFSGVPAGGPAPGVFFTRWITHFCAPAFIFLAGTSAFFYGRKHQDLSRFLFTRGLWLVVLELTFLRFAWTFNADYRHYEMAGVIWVIGMCMMLMAALVRLSPRALAIAGGAIVLLHNAIGPQLGSLGVFHSWSGGAAWAVLYGSFWNGPIGFGADGPNLIVLYSIVPWIGVMMLGYAFGTVLQMDDAHRRRWCLRIGLGATLLFLVLRAGDFYGDPSHWANQVHNPRNPMPPVLAFLNTSKYPASLLFLLMTLGPVIASMPLVERATGPLARALTTFGRVPFFFYMLHIPLIHLLALGVSSIRSGAVNPWLFTNHPMGNPPPPDGYTWSLGLLYLTWAVAIAILYAACRWYAALKARRTDWWLGYL